MTEYQRIAPVVVNTRTSIMASYYKAKENTLMTSTTSETKLVHIVCSRPLKELSVEVTPHDTAAAVLTKAGREPEDMLMKPGDQDAYEPTELPFDDVPDGGKLHVVPHCTVGA